MWMALLSPGPETPVHKNVLASTSSAAAVTLRRVQRLRQPCTVRPLLSGP